MNFSILITTYNQEKYLLRCINSCIAQNYKKSFEVIVCDTSLKSNYHIVKHFNKKNFHYFHKKKFSDDSIMDQTLKNYFMFKKSKGKVVCFLDGDDLFFKNKLRSISKIITNNSANHDKPIYFFEKNKKKKKSQISFLKKNLFYNKLINNWPIVLGTSCISTNREVLIKFFKNINNFKYNLLAIDIKLAIFSKKFYKYRIINKYLTYKSINDHNLDHNFNNFFSKIYWLRKKQQFDYSKSIGNFEFNINYIITRFVCLFV